MEQLQHPLIDYLYRLNVLPNLILPFLQNIPTRPPYIP